MNRRRFGVGDAFTGVQRRRRPGARTAGPGHHRLAPAAYVGPARARRVRGGARRAGGVGSLAIQLAREWGAGRIIATASTPEKRGVVEDLGADAVVDSEVVGLEERLRGANRGKAVDVVLEMVGGAVFDASYAVLGPFGRLVIYGAVSRAELFALVSSGRLRPLVGRDYPLSRAPHAHNDLKARRSVGKLILDPAR